MSNPRNDEAALQGALSIAQFEQMIDKAYLRFLALTNGQRPQKARDAFTLAMRELLAAYGKQIAK